MRIPLKILGLPNYEVGGLFYDVDSACSPCKCYKSAPVCCKYSATDSSAVRVIGTGVLWGNQASVIAVYSWLVEGR